MDSSWIEAATYHFEAESPRGLRVGRAILTDDEHEEPVEDTAYLRRIHLYRPGATGAGAGTATLHLRVSNQGFIVGAVTAAFLVAVGLFICANWRSRIALNPTSAPALLLLLPGLIASYVGRPDQHPLTSRLLSGARWLLLISALTAYVAAAFVAFSGAATNDPAVQMVRTAALEKPLWWAFGVAVSVFGLLGVTWLLSHPQARGLASFRWARALWRSARASRFTEHALLPIPPEDVARILDGAEGPALLSRRKNVEAHWSTECDGRRLTVVARSMLGLWANRVAVDVDRTGSKVEWTVDRVTRNPFPGFALRLRRRRVRRELEAITAKPQPPTAS